MTIDPRKRNAGIVVKHPARKSIASREDSIHDSWKDNDFHDERDDFIYDRDD